MRKFLVFLAAVLVLPLTGCVALDAGVALSGALDPKIVVFTDDVDVPYQQGQKVYPVSLHASAVFSNGCGYRGVLVMYARDWDVLGEDGRVIFKADPDTVRGKAVLVYNSDCNKQGGAVLMVGDERFNPAFGLSPAVKGDTTFKISEYRGLAQRNNIPKWMGQVIKEIQAEAATNPAAQDFLNHVKIENGLPVAPEAPAAGATTK
jgi:hypothetical protein